MLKNKKWLSLFLASVMALSFVGCAKEEAAVEENTMDLTTEEETVDAVEETNLEDLVNAYFANMPKHIYKIAQAEFVGMVKDDFDMTILDIRTKEDYDAGHVKGAVNAPWGTAVSDILKYVPNDKPLFVYCYSGQTAGQAVHTLNVAGFDARSANLGWNFGISKVEGVADVTVTTESLLTEEVTEIDTVVQTALDEYYAGLAAVKGTTFGNYKISEKSLKAAIDAGDDSLYILSIRDQADYDAGHIEGAAIIPWGQGMELSFETLPMDKKIVVYCYTGQTAGQTVAALRLLGYDAVSLNGGMGMAPNAPLGWSNQGMPVVK